MGDNLWGEDEGRGSSKGHLNFSKFLGRNFNAFECNISCFRAKTGFEINFYFRFVLHFKVLKSL
jgi:hypothetical protein